MLTRIRTMGLTRPGGLAAGLGEDFTITVADIPAKPEPGEPNRDLPPEIMAQLCAQLDRLTSPEMRTAIELAIDIGRRPEEICALDFDCLTRDDGLPVLIYDNHKANRPDRRLPIGEQTAAVIVAQQKRVRVRYPDTPVGELTLLPTDRRNPGGRRAITGFSLAFAHRTWVDRMPVLRTADGVEYDKSKVVLYAYRHSFAQRHADAGVSVDVLRELMSHRKLETTSGYYRVGETRRREAVDRVTAMQFDRHGNRIWRQAQALLDSGHARRAIGEVAVPFGVCAEPSNVKAGSGACPFRFRCAGCDHFRTDVSYLPDLHAHLDDLLRTRERPARHHRTRPLGTRRSDALGRRDPTHPPPDRPHRCRSRRTHRRTARADRARRHRRASTPLHHARHAPHPPNPARPATGANRMSTNTTTSAMIDGRRADSTRRRQRVLNALDAAVAAGDELGVTNIARRAGVDRTFIYRHRDLLERIHAAETQPPDKPGTGPAVTRASLQADLLAAQQRCTRMAARTQQLETRLSDQLGEQVWRASGLGAPTDIDELHTRIVTLEQQVIDLRLQLEERDQDLAAARAANRELMTKLNAS
ncbi:tyrosine-type recombinase/integrase, partial [Rhodococcus koreensis]